MLGPSLETVRLFLHVLAATIWVGGQLTLAALVPTLRRHDRDVPRLAARAFNRVAWPAFGVLVLTGIWNIAEEADGADHDYQVTLGVKVGVVVLSGVAALAHTRARTSVGLAVWGALTAVSALAALFVGVLLAG
jgi:putative copper export protein